MYNKILKIIESKNQIICWTRFFWLNYETISNKIQTLNISDKVLFDEH